MRDRHANEQKGIVKNKSFPRKKDFFFNFIKIKLLRKIKFDK